MGQNFFPDRNYRCFAVGVLCIVDSDSLSEKKRQDEGVCQRAGFSDLEKLYSDSVLRFVVLCIVSVCKCGQKLLSLHQYQMDVDFSGNCSANEL